jgi:hypothetical protein
MNGTNIVVLLHYTGLEMLTRDKLSSLVSPFRNLPLSLIFVIGEFPFYDIKTLCLISSLLTLGQQFTAVLVAYLNRLERLPLSFTSSRLIFAGKAGAYRMELNSNGC